MENCSFVEVVCVCVCMRASFERYGGHRCGRAVNFYNLWESD